MDIDDTTSKRARGRGRATRARARGRGRGTRARGRGKKAAARILSSDEEISQENPPEEIVPAIPVQVPIVPIAIQTADAVEDVTSNKENEIITPPEEIIPPTIDMEADISQLEAPTFTTISRGPPEPMLRLKWDHKVSLIGEKVLNPMIHCCDECEKPILVYGRMIPCKHIFCLKCARAEPIKLCPRCKDKVLRVEQSGLGTVFMCTHGGSRYGNTGCRRTYLSQRDLQAHINHRHVTPQVNPDSTVIKSTQLMDKSINMPQRKSTEPSTSSSGASSSTGTIGLIAGGIGAVSRPQQRSSQQQQQQQFAGSNISVGQSGSLISSRTNLINVPLQETGQQSMGKLNLQQSTSISSGLNQQQSMHSHHVSEALAAASYYSTSLQSYVSPSSGTYSAPTVQTVMTQNYGTIPSVQPQSGNSVMSGVMSSQSVIHNMQLASQAHLNSRSSNVPPLPAPPPPQAPAYYSPYGQHYGQMPHYQYDQNNYPGNTQNSQWNQQQYYR